MSQRTWFITGVSNGFGRELSRQLLHRGDKVVGTVRDVGKVHDLAEQYPEAFFAEVLDVTDTTAIRAVLERSFARCGRIDVIISNAGYGLFGAAEELTDRQIEHIVATNLVGSIQLIRAAIPRLRAQGGGGSSRFRPMAVRWPSPATPCTTRRSGASKVLSSRSPRRLRVRNRDDTH